LRTKQGLTGSRSERAAGAEKKNIAIVITRLDLGGAQKTALCLARKLDRKKFNVHFIAGRGGYLDRVLTGAEKRSYKGVVVNLWDEIAHPISPLLDSIAVFKLARYFKRNNMEIVNTHSSKAGILGRKAAMLAGVKRVYHTVHGFPFHEYQNPTAHFFYVMIEKIFAKITTKLIAVGRDTAEYGIKKGVGDAGMYEIIRAGIETAAFKGKKPKDRAFLKKHGLDPRKFTAGMIGNLKKQKNPDGFIAAAKAALKAEPDMQFVFAGGSAAGAQEGYESSEKIKFIGWTGEPGRFMRAIDIFFLPSLWEGLPCTLVQALCAGKPCVASDIGGNREILELAGDKRLLYNPKSPEDAAALIAGIKRGKIKPAKIKSAALKEFDEDYMVREYERVFK